VSESFFNSTSEIFCRHVRNINKNSQSQTFLSSSDSLETKELYNIVRNEKRNKIKRTLKYGNNKINFISAFLQNASLNCKNCCTIRKSQRVK
jgi:hypothetical protein